MPLDIHLIATPAPKLLPCHVFWHCSVGLKGVDPSNIEAVEQLVLSKLGELEKSGFSGTAVEAAINTIEFRCCLGFAAFIPSMSTFVTTVLYVLVCVVVVCQHS